MKSDTKNSDLVQVLTSLKKSEEFLYLRNKKVIHIKKKIKKITFSLLFCLHETSKNKNVIGNIIHNSSEVILLLQENCMTHIFVNPVRSLFSISVAFVLRTSFLARLFISSIFITI